MGLRRHRPACPLALAQFFDKRDRNAEPGRDGGLRGTGRGTNRGHPLPQIIPIDFLQKILPNPYTVLKTALIIKLRTALPKGRVLFRKETDENGYR